MALIARQESAWGTIWTRPGLELKTRSLLNLVMLTALGKWTELGTHVRGAVRNGASEVEIREALLQARLASLSLYVVRLEIGKNENENADRRIVPIAGCPLGWRPFELLIECWAKWSKRERSNESKRGVCTRSLNVLN